MGIIFTLSLFFSFLKAQRRMGPAVIYTLISELLPLFVFVFLLCFGEGRFHR